MNENNSNKKQFAFLGPLILFIIVFPIFGYVFFSLQKEERLLKKEGIVTEGVFIWSYYKADADVKGRSKGYVSFCEYKVDGIPYGVVFSGLKDSIPKGTTLLIKYYPADPAIREIVNKEKLDKYLK